MRVVSLRSGVASLIRVVLSLWVSHFMGDFLHCVWVISLCSVLYEDFVKKFRGSVLKYEQVPFNHPLFIMYSSGTTGTPKCMVHSVGVGARDRVQGP